MTTWHNEQDRLRLEFERGRREGHLDGLLTAAATARRAAKEERYGPFARKLLNCFAEALEERVIHGR